MNRLYRIDPLQDGRWPELLQRHPNASVFHGRPWLECLRRTYGYEPLAFTTAAEREPLMNAIVFVRIRSWLTGSRLVSMAFADHCEPLADSASELTALLEGLRDAVAHENCKYVELRPSPDRAGETALFANFVNCAAFHHHTLDLRFTPDELFDRMHKSCMQRKIRRAGQEGLTYEEGRSEEFLRAFYALLVRTRRRHGVPPQPFIWFRNLAECLGGAMKIRVVFKRARPIASMVTLQYNKTLLYKYGASDERYHAMGGMPLLFWRAMQDAKTIGAEEFDLGRCDLDNVGLCEFKRHLGAQCRSLSYYRYPREAASTGMSRARVLVSKLCASLPNPLCVAAGHLLYRHAG
jgi:CelD/BcsL family acetyltransferase involved in cellulose biosynthesis